MASEREASGPAVTPESPSAPEPTAREGPAVELARRAVGFARAHLVAVALVVLTGVLWAGFQVITARSSAVADLGQRPEVVMSAAPSMIKVHVVGAVASPQVVSLAEGSRVGDAIEAAGGFAEGADAGELNLAAVLADGSQIVIGKDSEPRGEVRTGTGGDDEARTADGRLSLSSATAAQLEELPGIGPVTAAAIIAWRTANDGFTRIEELQEVDGIGPKTYQSLADLVGP